MTILLLCLAILLSGVFTVTTLHFGADLLVRILGKDKCLSTEGINGCNWWPWSIILSVGAVMLLSRQIEFWALALTPAGPLFMLSLVGLQLRFGEWSARKREFIIRDGQVKDLRGNLITPLYVKSLLSYCCTGPASGYCLYSLVLYDSGSRLCSNGYVSKEEADRDLDRLYNEVGLIGLDLVFEWRKSITETWSVTFSPEWTPVLCPSITRMSVNDQSFWGRFLQPAFGRSGRETVDGQELLSRVDSLENTFAGEIKRDDRFQNDCRGLRNLITRAGEQPIHVTTTDEHSQNIEKCRGDGITEHRTEDLVWVSVAKSRENYK